MTWRAYIDGHEFDLAELAAQFAIGRVRVVTSDGECWVEADEFESLSEPSDVRDVAVGVVARINGTMKMTNTGFVPVELNDRIGTDSAAGATVFLTPEVMVGRARVTMDMSGGTPTSATPIAQQRLDKATNQPDVAEALALLASAEPDWVALYKVFEIVRADVKDVPTSSATSADCSAFKASANLKSVSGTDARHARDSSKGGTPKRTMNIEEGREFIRSLVTSWIDSK